MTRIRLLDVAGFRGIRLAAPLDFTSACTSMVVYGANGHGKSSYVDALECYFTGRIGHLEKENVSRAAYRHRAHPADELALVRVEFADATSNGQVTIDESRRPVFEASGSSAERFREQAQHELIILRHRDLSRFVDLTKQEKLSDLAALIGVEVLDRTRRELRTAVRQLESDLSAQNQLIRERHDEVARRVGPAEFDLAQAWNVITEHARALGWDTEIRDLPALQAALADIRVLVDPARDKQLKILEETGRVVEHVAQQPNPSDEARIFAVAFDSLAADQKALQDLALTGLWEAGLGVLHSAWWASEQCPLCRQRVADRATFERELDSGVSAAAEARRRRDEVEALRDRARQALRSTHDSLQRLTRVAQGLEECGALLISAGSARAMLGDMLAEVDLPVEPGRFFSSELLGRWDGNRSQLLSDLQASREALTIAVSQVAVSDEERKRQESYRALSALESELARLESLEAQQQIVDIQARSMRRVLREFEQHERRSITGILDQISGNVTLYYQALHGGERYANVRLEFLPDDRGLEFSLEAFGERVSPPRLVLSESHLNSLGLCLFLAAAREFNSEAGFLVLDDIVNSFDAEHRAQLANLLIREFADYQVVTFTHDPIWFDILRRMAPTWEVRKILGWSYELGIHMQLGLKEDRERIDGYLDQGNEEVAGNLARQYVERQLKRLCSQLRVPIPFKEGYENERRSPDELVRFLRRDVDDRQHFAGRETGVWQEFGACNFITNLASHDQPDMPIPLSAGDIRFALEKLDELVSLFKCPSCKKWVWKLRADPSSAECQCECGDLKFR